MVTTIAILGATGKTGRQVLQRFLAKQDVNIRIYVRSHSKLTNIFPSLPSDSRVSIFQGPLQDIDNMSKCLDGAQKIIFTLGENDNLPGVSVIEDGAKSVLAALAALRQGRKNWQRPRVILLSSATWNATFAATRPALVHWAIKAAFIHPYTDLRRGQAVFLDAPSLVSVLLVQPNAIVEDEPSGHEISVERASLSVTYGDLSAGIVDLACKKEFDTLTAVGVSSKAGDNGLKYGPILGYRIVRGLCATYVPGFWSVNKFVNAIISTVTFKRKTI
ncbi:hypothetical protein W97_00737 [Coniosporium apollinis CBS 100218]|uniref:NAD(P)-binding domain-containing protein n=1 Tax=Coniosporium apollinis (strain CBS 100218) TaxID=1168221 RepID=R7YHZ4_CONA1|nr:uncharacterized protein W97_00737 [Coniosporium apollinis CBS 100218]EON61522.1 hypothetical protein W97_00737 [Coniosporium apollinis CBS 100218]